MSAEFDAALAGAVKAKHPEVELVSCGLVIVECLVAGETYPQLFTVEVGDTTPWAQVGTARALTQAVEAGLAVGWEADEGGE